MSATATDERVCPWSPEEKGCWWVVEGHPHGDGYGCSCLVTSDRWVPHCEVNIFDMSTVCSKGTQGCAGEWHD